MYKKTKKQHDGRAGGETYLKKTVMEDSKSPSQQYNLVVHPGPNPGGETLSSLANWDYVRIQVHVFKSMIVLFAYLIMLPSHQHGTSISVSPR